MTKYITLTIMLLLAGSVLAKTDIVQVHAAKCTPGVHTQPDGPFALYVFCDDALGTNIAIFLDKMYAPIHQDYNLGKRFWQDQEWSFDVMSFAWLPGNRLLISTSAIYGSGSVYLIDLSAKQAKVLLNIEGALIELVSVKEKQINVRYQRAPAQYEYTSINLE